MPNSNFIVRKVVSTLPASLTPNTLYFVRVLNGFDVYLTDITGIPYKQNGILPALMVDGSRPVAYVGKINEIIKIYYSIPGTIARARCATSNLSSDWPNRANLTFVSI